MRCGPTSAGCDCERTVRQELFGVLTDFTIKSERVGDQVKITVSCIPPRVEFDRANNVLRVFPHLTS